MEDTKIKYLRVCDKLYQIADISFFNFTIRAVESPCPAASIPENEVWNIEEFKNYKITLVNNGGQAEIVDFTDYKTRKVDNI